MYHYIASLTVLYRDRGFSDSDCIIIVIIWHDSRIDDKDSLQRNMVRYIRKSPTKVFDPTVDHYENKPIQIFRKFHFQKLKIFR